MASDSTLANKLPQNIDAERAVLGSILLNNETMKIAGAILKSSDFFHNHHKYIFSAVSEMYERHQAVDELTLIDFLSNAHTLDLAGGPAAIASLMDGVPKISNVEFYAKIVQEKSRLRGVIEIAGRMQEMALSQGANVTTIQEEFRADIKTNSNGHQRCLQLTDGIDLLTMNTAPLEWVIEPILPTQGLGMLYAWRGCGKTYLMLEICYNIAAGSPRCFLWKIPKPRRVVYVDGELAANQLQDRWQRIIRGHAMKAPDPKMIGFTNRSVDKFAPNIATPDGQHMIEDLLEPGTFLVLDNISALCRTAKEDEEGWASTQEWLVDLKHSGIAVWLLHHAGKQGTQRGTSKREDFLDAIIKMCHPPDYSPEQLLRCEIHSEKYRGDDPNAVVPFEVSLETDHRGAAIFMHKPLKDVIDTRYLEMVSLGMKVSEIAESLNISRFQVYRIQKRLSRL